MNDDPIKSLWNLGKRKERKMNTEEIQSILHRSAKRAWTELRRLVWFYLAVMVAILVVNGMNIAAYRSNAAWVGVDIALTLLAAGFAAFGAHIIAEMRRLDNYGDGLAVVVRRQLEFFRTKYQVWLVVVALGIWLLGFAVSLYLYNENGHYRVHQDMFLVGFTAAQLVIIYAIVRVAHYPFLQRILAALHDIDAQVAERTQTFERGQKYRVLIGIAAALIGLAVFIALLFYVLGGAR
jgi:hypothetical protein